MKTPNLDWPTLSEIDVCKEGSSLREVHSGAVDPSGMLRLNEVMTSSPETYYRAPEVASSNDALVGHLITGFLQPLTGSIRANTSIP